MPTRLLREGIISSDRIDLLDWPAEVFYRRLMSKVDDHGLFDARPSMLRSSLYPLRVDRVREADIARWIAACETAGVLALYDHGGKPFGQMLDTNWQARSEPKHPLPPWGKGKRPCATENNCSQPITPVTVFGVGVGDVSEVDNPLPGVQGESDEPAPNDPAPAPIPPTPLPAPMGDDAPVLTAAPLTARELVADGLTEQTAAEFVALRKKKRAPLTLRAWEGIREEADAVGWTIETAIRKCLTRGWQSFDRKFVSDNVRTGGDSPRTFRERDADVAAARVAEMTGGRASAKPTGSRADPLQEIFDVTPRLLG